jgi:hypothetical protein
MENAICAPTMQSLFETLVEPAIQNLLNNGHGNYRCERDLHHHFTVCLDRIHPLHLGSREPVLHTERPAVACYGSGRRGNIDFFVADERSAAGSKSGVAVEVNWNYNDTLKVQRDLCKLTDPRNAYAESVYLAYGSCQDMLTAVQAGLDRAFTTFVEAAPDFLLPAGLRIIVAVRQRHRDLVIHSTVVDKPCTPSQLSWSDSRDENHVEQNNGPVHRTQDYITFQGDKMTNFNDEDLSSENRNSYQTAPLSAYSAENQRSAVELYDKTARLGARAKPYKGSYSFFGTASQETVAKIIIYEEGKGKVNGKSHLRTGVYALIRANGRVGERNRAAVAANGLLAALLSSDTIGVAPAHGERFHYLRVDDSNLNQCIELLDVIART